MDKESVYIIITFFVGVGVCVVALIVGEFL